MKNFFLIDGARKFSTNELLKIYGSQEKLLLNIYNWDKCKEILPNENGDFIRNVN